MTEHDRLLHAVLDEPAEDAPRLVYADWLDDHGTHERAEFIRAQVELASLDEADPRYPACLARSRRSALFATAPGAPWIDHIPGASVSFRRGFITRAIIPANDYLQHSTDRWRSVPLEELILGYNGEGVGVALAARVEFDRLRLFGFQGGWFAQEMRPLLTGCRHLAGLRELYMEGVYTPDSEADEEDQESALGDLPQQLQLPGVEALSWWGGSPLDWPIFVPAFRRPLRRLILESMSDPDLEEDADAWGWLVGSHHWPNLRQVNVWHHTNTIGYSSVYSTPPLPDFARNFSACPAEDLRLGVSDLQNLEMQSSWGALRTLRIGHGDLTDDLLPLARSPQSAQLRRLFLDHPDGPEPEIGDPLPDVLAGAHLANLQHLRIAGYFFADDDLAGIVAGAYRERLLGLDLGESGVLADRQVADLVSRPWPELRSLRITLARSADLAPLLATRNLPNLCTLMVSGWPGFTDADIAAFQAPGMPHLSLIETSSREWILGGGTAQKVDANVWLRETDLLENGPYK